MTLAPLVLPPADPVGRASRSLDVVIDRDARVLDLIGEFDFAGAASFAFAAATLTVRRGDVSVDLGRLRFIGAAGLGSLIGLRNTLARSGDNLRLVHPTRAVRRVFEVTYLTDLLSPREGPPATTVP